LSNKEMVDWLRAHEYDVKSHSSSLEDDQALAVVEKFKGEKGPKVEAPKSSGSGVVLRRKKADTAAEHEHAAALAAQQAAVAAERLWTRRPGTGRRPVGPGHRKSHVAADRDARSGAVAAAYPDRTARSPGAGGRRLPPPSGRRGPRAGRRLGRSGPRPRIHRRHQGQQGRTRSARQ